MPSTARHGDTGGPRKTDVHHSRNYEKELFEVTAEE